jgi:acyl dehydratase
MIPYPDLLRLRSPEVEFGWTDKDALLYALGVGMGVDPLDADELPFVYEKQLKVLPTFATVAAWGSNPSLAEAQVDYAKVVHGAQEVILHEPLPPAARVRVEGGVTGAVDKGDKGALIFAETLLRDAASGRAYATLKTTWFARGDGRFGGPTTGGEEPHPIPDRAPDLSLDMATRPDQALLYRLLGDRNPLHVDLEVARRAGFERPILHGLCTFGITGRAVLQAYAAFDPRRIASHAVRFSAPVLPGDVVSIDMWKDGPIVSFEARVRARDLVVVKNGKTVLAG